MTITADIIRMAMSIPGSPEPVKSSPGLPPEIYVLGLPVFSDDPEIKAELKRRLQDFLQEGE